MPNPLAAAEAFLDADATNLPDGTDYGTALPQQGLATLYVQFARDGTPSDADNREDATVRFTVWGPHGDPIAPQDAAGPLRRRLLLWSSADVQRVDRGAGRLPGVDPDTELPFCSFTVQLVLRAS